MVRFDASIAGLSSLMAVLLILTCTSTILRFVARRKQKQPLQLDDWFTIPPPLCIIGITGLAIYGMTHGFMGVEAPKDHALQAPPSQTEKVYFPNDAFTILALGSIRLSALLFYRRIFCSGKRRDFFNTVTWVMIVIVVLWTVGFFIETFMMCGGSIAKIYAADKQCTFVPYLVGLGLSSFILDVMVIALPIPKIWGLHTSTTRKLSITAVFMLALAGLGASCARMVIFIFLWQHEGPQMDSYVSNSLSFYYQALEVGLCATAVNLPSLWYLVRGVPTERVLRSVRSLVSLGSATSKHSKHSQGSFEKTTRSFESQSGLTNDNSTHEAFVESLPHESYGVPNKREDLEMAAMREHRAPK